ncbi:MAG TPA: DinB family protein [Thermoanaerobaculia bacterium]|nr:DinB family protein [Thermoanaerobaculia bacterium]
MKEETALREQLVRSLDWDSAHIRFEQAVEEFPRELRGRRAGPHSAWELLEHLRITLWDIVEFTRDAKSHVSPEFPSGYWPASSAPPDDAAWEASIEQYRDDLKKLAGIAADPSIDLYAKIEGGDGQTVLREILLSLDHNAYHLGQFMIVRKTLTGA